MEAPETIFIVASPFLHGARRWNYGDRYERDKVGLDDLTDRTLKKIGQIVVLTRESYANAIVRREEGAVGSGFTIDFLVERGIIDKAKAAEHGFFAHGAIVHKGYWIVTRIVEGTGFRKYEVLNRKSEPMRETKFNSLDKARAFIETLPAEESDVVHVRPESVRAA